jgi:hypothetical protein
MPNRVFLNLQERSAYNFVNVLNENTAEFTGQGDVGA